jgi:hypothetical protein
MAEKVSRRDALKAALGSALAAVLPWRAAPRVVAEAGVLTKTFKWPGLSTLGPLPFRDVLGVVNSKPVIDKEGRRLFEAGTLRVMEICRSPSRPPVRKDDELFLCLQHKPSGWNNALHPDGTYKRVVDAVGQPMHPEIDIADILEHDAPGTKLEWQDGDLV